jgi:hypothetical protein
MTTSEIDALIARRPCYEQETEDRILWMGEAIAALRKLQDENARLRAQAGAGVPSEVTAKLLAEIDRLSDALRLAEIDAAPNRIKELLKDSARLHWLHSSASCKPDIHGCEWGIWRVSWQGGKANQVWATASDFSDLDAAMRLSESYDAAIRALISENGGSSPRSP